MSKMFTRAIVTAVLAVVALVTIADAQNKRPAPPPNTKPNITRPGNGSGRMTGDGISDPSTYPMGWNSLHVTNCGTTDYQGDIFLVVYPAEGGYFYTDSPGYQRLLGAACQTGNFIALHVYDDLGDWDEIYTYTYQ